MDVMAADRHVQGRLRLGQLAAVKLPRRAAVVVSVVEFCTT